MDLAIFGVQSIYGILFYSASFRFEFISVRFELKERERFTLAPRDKILIFTNTFRRDIGNGLLYSVNGHYTEFRKNIIC